MPPRRWDLGIYNETLGFVITSKNRGGLRFSRRNIGSKKWIEAIQKGIFLIIQLAADYGFTLRVVLDDQLSEQEEQEWVSRIRWKLKIEDGMLTIAAGDVYLFPGELDREYIRESVRFLEVPPGLYEVELYGYRTCLDGELSLEKALRGEPMESYIARAKTNAPLLAKEECIDFLMRLVAPTQPPENPPAFSFLENELRVPRQFPVGVPAAGLIDLPRLTSAQFDADTLVIRGKNFGLVPKVISNNKPIASTQIKMTSEKKIILTGSRKALHLKTTNQIRITNCGLSSDPYIMQLKAAGERVIYTFKVYDRVKHVPLFRIYEGPVEHAVIKISQVYRLTLLHSPKAHPEILLGLPSRHSYELPFSEDYCLEQEGDRLRFTFRFEHTSSLESISRSFDNLPRGAVLEMVTYASGYIGETDQYAELINRYKGIVDGGLWLISESYPELTAQVLSEALAFSEEVGSGKRIRAKNPEELIKIQNSFSEDVGISTKLITDGLVISVGEGRHLFLRLAKAAFRVRFGEFWSRPDKR